MSAVEVLEGELDREVDKVIIMNIVTNIKYDQLPLTNVQVVASSQTPGRVAEAGLARRSARVSRLGSQLARVRAKQRALSAHTTLRQ